MRRLLIALAFLPLPILAATPEFTLIIKDHKFEPNELLIPANTKVKLIIENQDSTPEEFESHKLDREKVIAGGAKATLFIGPLEPGGYPFVGEFNEDTARGLIVVE